MIFLAKFTPTIKTILWIMAAISLIGLVVGVFTLAGAQLEITSGQAVLLISVCSLTLILATLLVTIHYKVDSTHLRLNIAFVDILGGRIRIDKILNIVLENDKMYISYLWKGPDPVIALVAINPKRFQAMQDVLTSKNKNIVIYDKNHNGTTDSE